MATDNLGRVVLVGAGPGDPGLLTLKGKRWLELADVVVYDDWVHSNLLTLCRSDAELICVGKRNGHSATGQADINRLLVSYAQNRKTVVWLEGGDSLVFGAGVEGLETLTRHQIPVEVVPGVSSAWAVPAYAGIPLTHRDLGRSVALVSGLLFSADSPKITALPTADTVVVFMAETRLQLISKLYIESRHFAANTPVAVIYRGTLASQKTIFSNLSRVGADVEAAEISAPAMLVIGDVVRLAPDLKWTLNLRLFGQRIVVLRAIHQSLELTQKLARFGAEVIQLPVLQFEKKSENLMQISPQYLSRFSMIIFTSPNGVGYFMDSILSQGMDARVLVGKKVVAIGPKTAQVLKTYGILADIQPEHYHSEGIAQTLPPDLANIHVLMPVAAGADPMLEIQLTERGAKVTVLKIYETVAPEAISLTLYSHDWIVFTSPSSVAHFFEKVWDGQTPIRCVSIGNKTTLAIQSLWSGHIVEAHQASDDALVDAILREVGG